MIFNNVRTYAHTHTHTSQNDEPLHLCRFGCHRVQSMASANEYMLRLREWMTNVENIFEEKIGKMSREGAKEIEQKPYEKYHKWYSHNFYFLLGTAGPNISLCLVWFDGEKPWLCDIHGTSVHIVNSNSHINGRASAHLCIFRSLLVSRWFPSAVSHRLDPTVAQHIFILFSTREKKETFLFSPLLRFPLVMRLFVPIVDLFHLI